MNHILSVCYLAAGLICLIGCGSTNENLVQVTGTVTMGDTRLYGVDVTFIPDGDTQGNGGTGRTDSDGEYSLTNRRGELGIEPGTYRVVLSRLLLPDGTPLPADSEVDPMSSEARESLQPRYSSHEQTILTAKVADGGEPIDFRLTAEASP